MAGLDLERVCERSAGLSSQMSRLLSFKIDSFTLIERIAVEVQALAVNCVFQP